MPHFELPQQMSIHVPTHVPTHIPTHVHTWNPHSPRCDNPVFPVNCHPQPIQPVHTPLQPDAMPHNFIHTPVRLLW